MTTATSTSADIDRLLKEGQTSVLRERRAVERQPFVRPVTVVLSRNGETVEGFSKDMSPHGIALITRREWPSGTQSTLKILSLFGSDVEVRSEARWSAKFGRGWFVTGWHFLDRY